MQADPKTTAKSKSSARKLQLLVAITAGLTVPGLILGNLLVEREPAEADVNNSTYPIALPLENNAAQVHQYEAALPTAASADLPTEADLTPTDQTTNAIQSAAPAATTSTHHQSHRTQATKHSKSSLSSDPTSSASDTQATSSQPKPSPTATASTSEVDCSNYAKYPTVVQSNERRPGRPAECVKITGGTTAQRKAVSSYLKSYGTYSWVDQIILDPNLSSLGLATACSPFTQHIKLKSTMTGQQLKMVTAHEISHAVLSYIYNGNCNYVMGDLADKFGGYEEMTDCLAQAMTGSKSYLYYKPNGCTSKQVSLAKQMAKGYRI